MPFFDKDGNEVTIDASAPEVKDLLSAAVAEATGGLTKNRDQILAEKKALEEKNREISQQWEGMDPKMVKAIMERMQNDEETKLMAEGKIDEVLERRTGAMKTDYEKQLAKEREEREALAKDRDGLSGKVKTMLINGMVRQAATEHDLNPSAVEDAIQRAKNVFQIDENDKPLAKNADGTIVVGKDAKSPISVSEWLGNMKETAPHWFKSSSGAGAQGGPGAGGANDGYTISRDDARNPAKYRQAKALAEKAGQELQIVEG